MSSGDLPRPDPTDGLDRVLQSLNDAFYAVEPAAYLRHRLTAALRTPAATADAPTEEDPMSLRGQVLSRLPGWALEEETDAQEDARSLAVEAFALAHHAGEVLLRHVLSQLDARSHRTSPWLTLAALQDSKEFRRRCKALLDASDEDLNRVLDALFLPHRMQVTDQVGGDTVTAARTFVAAWIRHFAAYYLDTSSGYNAVKHGLSGLPSHARISLYVSAQDGEPAAEVPLMAGAMLETLESSKVDGRREWSRVIRGVDPAGLLACAAMATTLLEWLWAVGKALHAGEPALLPLHDGPLPGDVMRGHEPEWGRFSRQVAVLPLTGDEAVRVLQDLSVEAGRPQQDGQGHDAPAEELEHSPEDQGDGAS